MLQVLEAIRATGGDWLGTKDSAGHCMKSLGLNFYLLFRGHGSIWRLGDFERCLPL